MSAVAEENAATTYPIPEGKAWSIALVYQHKQGVIVTFDDGETMAVDTLHATRWEDGITVQLQATSERGGVSLAINMARVAAMEADLTPAEDLLMRLLASGMTGAELRGLTG